MLGSELAYKEYYDSKYNLDSSNKVF